jgi:hypothetical protein
LTNPSAQQGAADAKKNCYDDASGISSRHQEFPNDADDQTKNNPTYNSRFILLFFFISSFDFLSPELTNTN